SAPAGPGSPSAPLSPGTPGGPWMPTTTLRVTTSPFTTVLLMPHLQPHADGPLKDRHRLTIRRRDRNLVNELLVLPPLPRLVRREHHRHLTPSGVGDLHLR